ncbi:CGNR zinc finger domain-containing protein [Nocardioides sp.]|uniref:CGNR zinc finger domain-containing protein n=1 Tax=Nocardioides sp. TaxID=35761 RepID=UPI00321BD86A
MRFDSHVEALLAAAVGLVNHLTPGHDGISPLQPPSGRACSSVCAQVLVSQGRHPNVTEAQGAELASYAVLLRGVFAATAAGAVDDAARQVNDLLERTGARPRLDLAADGWGLHFHGPDDGLVVGWSAGIAAALALCLGSDLAGVLGICSADPCDRVFVDGSRNGTRRFCSTRCQNRVKAAAHRRRP